MSAPWVELLAKILSGQPKLPEAACRDHVELFDRAADGDTDSAARAVTICESCPVLAACGEWIATARRPPPGVTAGKYTPTKEPKGKK